MPRLTQQGLPETGKSCRAPVLGATSWAVLAGHVSLGFHVRGKGEEACASHTTGSPAAEMNVPGALSTVLCKGE